MSKSVDTRVNILTSDVNSLRIEVDGLKHDMDTLRQSLDGLSIIVNSVSSKLDTVINLMQLNNSSLKQDMNSIGHRVVALEQTSALTTHNLKNIRGELILGGYMRRSIVDGPTLQSISMIIMSATVIGCSAYIMLRR